MHMTKIVQESKKATASSPLETLQELGFEADEVQVYLTLLEIGVQPASVIAKKAGLKRGYTYNILTRLVDKGIVHQHQKETVLHFAARTPTTLLSLLSHREEEIAVQKRKVMGLLPLLEKLRNPLIIQPKVRFYQGVEGLKEVYNDTIRVPGQPLYALCDFEHAFPEQTSKELHDWMWRYTDRRAAQNVWYLGIVNKSKDSDLAYRWRVKQKRKMKMLSDVYLPVELNVYGDKVALISTKDDMVGVIIEDRPIAQMLRNFHQAMWPLLPAYRA